MKALLKLLQKIKIRKKDKKDATEDDWGGALPYQRLRSQYADADTDTDHDEHEGYGFPEDEESVFDNFLIIGLCVFVGWLVYVRQFGAGNPGPVQPNANPADLLNPMPMPGPIQDQR